MTNVGERPGSIRGFPYLYIITGGIDVLAIARPDDRVDRIFMPGIGVDAIPIGRIPNLDGIIAAGRSDHCTIGRPCHCRDIAGVADIRDYSWDAWSAW
mgnify:CR=1 FL=1